jgi:outer membrane protein
MVCRLRIGSLLFVFFAAFGVPTTGALAQEGTTVAVVDVQRLLRESLAGQTIESQMQQFRVSFGEQIAQKEAVLREKERVLIEQSAIVSSDVLTESRRQFEEEVVALQREVREQQLGVEQSYAEAIDTIRQTVITILQGLVEQRGIDVVLPRSGYLVASRELDLTDDVLAELNSALPSMSLDLPSGG